MTQTNLNREEMMHSLRNKKLYKVHIDITIKGQFTTKVIPSVISVMADDEQEAKNIARHTTFSVNVGKAKMEMDFGSYRKEHGYE